MYDYVVVLRRSRTLSKLTNLRFDDGVRVVGKIRAESATSSFLRDSLMFGMANRFFRGLALRKSTDGIQLFV
jgi:hypothetical protein